MNVFICHVPFHYYLFKSTYKHLKNSCFIIPPFSDNTMTAEYGSGMNAKGKYEYVLDFLRRKQVEVVDYGERSGNNLGNFLNQNTRNVIITHWFDGIYSLKNVRIIGFLYSLTVLQAKQRALYGIENNFLSDIILTYGTDSAGRYNNEGLKAQPVGNPTFDEWFSNAINKDDIKLIKKRLDSNKSTILYLPTHSSYSSIGKYLNSIMSLSNDYNIIIKLHHLTFTQETNRLCKLLSNNELIVLGDYFDPLPLYKLADIILTDSSGAFFDALLLEKPVIRLSVSSQNNGIDLLYGRDNSYSGVKSFSLPLTSRHEELKILIADKINKKPSLNESIKYSLFFKTDGCAGKRAAEAILNDRKYPAIPTLEKYERAIENAPDEKTRKYIINKRNYFKNKYHQIPAKKSSLLERILNRLSFG